MHGGEGACRRYQDYMLGTGQWTYGSDVHGSVLSQDQLEERQRRAAERENAKRRMDAYEKKVLSAFMTAMNAAGRRGLEESKLPLGGTVRCWPLYGEAPSPGKRPAKPRPDVWCVG